MLYIIYIYIYICIYYEFTIENKNELRKRHSPVSKHLRMPETKLKTIKFNCI